MKSKDSRTRFFTSPLAIGVLSAVSSLRLTLRLPVSGHSLLFAYVILRRLFIRVPD